MNRLVLFLNELSCICEDPALCNTTLAQVLSTLQTIREVKKIRPDVLIAGETSLLSILLGDGTQSFTTILGGNLYKEEWRFLSNLEQSSPWNGYPHTADPGHLEEITFEGRTARGMTWARKNSSTVFSFGYPPHWHKDRIQAQFDNVNIDGKFASDQIYIPNLSKPEHVGTHSEKIRNYGGDVSPSSLIYEADRFVIRMYFLDHDPPHFHVLLHKNTNRTQAKCTIRTLDILSGRLPPTFRRKVIEWAGTHRNELMTNWERCRIGTHPIALGE